MDYRDKLHKNTWFLTNPLRVALFTAGLMLLQYPVTALAAASTIEAGSGAVAETKPASTYGTTKVIASEETEAARANWVQEGMTGITFCRTAVKTVRIFSLITPFINLTGTAP